MFIAMNRFSVKRDRESEFVALWKTRDSHLDGVAGFRRFDLLRGPESEDSVVYATHTEWLDEGAFRDWVASDAFKKAHQGARPDPEMFSGPNVLEKFTSVMHIYCID
jgi:heme-degrading monooxygenase HmoA